MVRYRAVAVNDGGPGAGREPGADAGRVNPECLRDLPVGDCFFRAVIYRSGCRSDNFPGLEPDAAGRGGIGRYLQCAAPEIRYLATECRRAGSLTGRQPVHVNLLMPGCRPFIMAQ